MSALAELIPSAQSLSRIEKVQLIQMLVGELAGVELIAPEGGQTYDVWSPHAAFDAAGVMLRVLADEARP